MKLVLNMTPDNGAGKTNHALQKRFDKLWKQLQSKKQRNEKFKKDIEALATVYHTQLRPVEMEMVDPLSRLVERLIDFSLRKSLSNRHRDGLAYWVVESINIISRFDSKKASELSESYYQAMVAMFGLPLAEEDDLPSPDQLFGENFGGNDPNEKSFKNENEQNDLFDNVEGTEGFDEARWNDESSWSHLEPDSKPAMGSSFNAKKWMGGLFRRLANKLHPDKETDPTRKAEKQQLMVELLEARKNEDVMTMLTLYSEQVEGGDLALAEQDMKDVCELLKANASRLDNERDDFLFDNPQNQIVYELLYSSTKSGREKKLATSIRNIKEINDKTHETTSALRNLTILRGVLNQREEMMWSQMWGEDHQWD
jgi:hypothetical protein